MTSKENTINTTISNLFFFSFRFTMLHYLAFHISCYVWEAIFLFERVCTNKSVEGREWLCTNKIRARGRKQKQSNREKQEGTRLKSDLWCFVS